MWEKHAIADNQFGFRRGHSVQAEVATLTQAVIDTWACKPAQKVAPPQTVILAIDLRKAFDCAPRAILIQKLLKLQVNKHLVLMSCEWLYDREIQTKFGFEVSSIRKVATGLPQGQ